MKRTRRKRPAPQVTEPTPDQIRQRIQLMSDEHQQAWQQELTSAAPYWVHLISLHLRMVELEHLEEATEELL